MNMFFASSSADSDGFKELLSQAKVGDRAALGRILDASRNYLRQVAGLQISDDLQAKLSVSDLVQDTYVDAQQAFQQFRGSTRAELFGWLRQILVNNLLNHYRAYRETQKRSLAREVALSSSAVGAADGGDTPSQLCVQQEEAARLQKALAALSDEHQQVIQWRHQEGLSFPEIGERMNRSPDAARMLWYRAYERLAAKLDVNSE